jgi:hypothetical protein
MAQASSPTGTGADDDGGYHEYLEAQAAHKGVKLPSSLASGTYREKAAWIKQYVAHAAPIKQPAANAVAGQPTGDGAEPGSPTPGKEPGPPARAQRRSWVDQAAVRTAAAAEWQRSPAVRQEFRGDEGAFVAYQVAAASGQVQVGGGKK